MTTSNGKKYYRVYGESFKVKASGVLFPEDDTILLNIETA